MSSERAGLTEDEKRWSRNLNEYGFSHLDDFDLVLLNGVQRGYFDEEMLNEAAKVLERQSADSASWQAFETAWDGFHASFDDDQERFVAALSAGFEGAIPFISPSNLNSTIKALKKLGEDEMARVWLSLYVARRTEDKEFFGLNSDPFGAEIDDPEVRSAFEEKLKSFVDTRDPRAVLLAVSRKRGWSPGDTELLASLSVADFKEIFKSTKGSDLHASVRMCLEFGTMGNADENMKHIAATARAALREIGAESPINALRVGKWGVHV